LFYRRLLLLERSLVQPVPEIPASVPLDFGRLDRSEIGKYLTFHPGEGHTEIERRLDRGDVCFLAHSQGRIVGAVWATRDCPFVRYLHTELTIAPDEVYFYDRYTAPDLRGRGIAPALDRYVFDLNRDALDFDRAPRVRRAIVAIIPENRASLRARAKTGFHVFGRVGYVQLGPWRRHFRRRTDDDRD
jgi:GNAT superfamily N-acetyltransferase